MELNETVLADLPDAAFYHLLSLCSLAQIVKFKSVLGKQRAPVFHLFEKEYAQKYHLEGLGLEVIYRILGQESKDDSALEALSEGDYPEYITSILDDLEDHWEVLRHAVENHREESALVLLEGDSVAGDLPLTIEYRCGKCLQYLVTKHDFQETILDYLYQEYGFFLGGAGYLSEEDLIWALETAQPKLDEEFATVMLAKSDEVSPALLRAVLQRMTDEDVARAYARHQLSFGTGRSARGGDYSHGQELNAVFEERLAK